MSSLWEQRNVRKKEPDSQRRFHHAWRKNPAIEAPVREAAVQEIRKLPLAI